MPSWSQTPAFPIGEIDFGTVTHVIQFGVCVEANGDVSMGCEGLTLDAARRLSRDAHAHGRRALLSVHGYGTLSHSNWVGATSPERLSNFVAHLVRLVVSAEYDGIDIDWEPLIAEDKARYVALVRAVRTSLDRALGEGLVTVAASAIADVYRDILSSIDQVNLMTYDLAGVWDASVTGHNAPLYSAGRSQPPDIAASVDAKIAEFRSAGVPLAKLGVGLPFYGWEWCGGRASDGRGVRRPGEQYSGVVTMNKVNYSDVLKLIDNIWPHQWDAQAYVPFLSVNGSGSSPDCFLTYDNDESIKAKMEYVLRRGLGGVMIWHLGADYVDGRQPLMGAIRRTLVGQP
jgi:chitinase